MTDLMKTSPILKAIQFLSKLVIKLRKDIGENAPSSRKLNDPFVTRQPEVPNMEEFNQHLRNEDQ